MVDSIVQSSVSLLIFCQFILPVAERGIITLSHNCRIVYMSQFCPFLLYVSDALLLSIYTYLIAKSSWRMVTFYYYDNKMSLVILWYYNNHSSFLILYLFLLMVYAFCSISFKLSLSLYLTYVSCRQHIVWSDDLWLLITMFRPSTFNVRV